MPENGSLKDKRGVLKSIISRVENRFGVAIAEIEDQDLWQVATLGVVCVSNNGRHSNELLSKVMDFIVSIRGDAEILDYSTEILHVF